jgi:hypothetical protein
MAFGCSGDCYGLGYGFFFATDAQISFCRLFMALGCSGDCHGLGYGFFCHRCADFLSDI